MPNKSIFKLSNVTFSVARLKILKDISLGINSNDFMVLLGPSGSGKSTLLRLLNGLNSSTSGKINFHEDDILNIDTIELRKKVGMVFQSPTMISGSVRDNLILSQKWLKDNQSFSDSELVTMLENVGLEAKFLEKDAKSLSGGEQQRIALARVLLNKPEVLLLDEPTANLDPQLALKILYLICELYKKLNLTVVLITHHHREIEEFAKQVLFLVDGKIVESGGKGIIRKPQSVEAQAFIAKATK